MLFKSLGGKVLSQLHRLFLLEILGILHQWPSKQPNVPAAAKQMNVVLKVAQAVELRDFLKIQRLRGGEKTNSLRMRFRGQASPEHSIRLSVYVTGCGREERLVVREIDD
jgi:hypothetical protein